MTNLFTATGYIKSGILETDDGRQLEFSALPPFLRVLLTTDGTVTKNIESYFWEPVGIVDVEQQKVELDEYSEELEQKEGYELLERTVVLEGESTKDVYAFARSLICLKLLPKGMAANLVAGKVGIGEIIRDSGLETYRELLSYGEEYDEDCGGDQIWRSYRIVIDGVPVIHVTEWFPLDIYEEE